MRRLIISALLLITILEMNAAERRFSMFYINKYDLPEFLTNCINEDMQHRNEPRRVMPINDILLGNIGQEWTDGIGIFSTFYERQNREIETNVFHNYSDQPDLPIGPMNVTGKKVTLESDKNLVVTVEKIGNYTMLVVRNAQGVPVKAFYHITNDQANNGYITIFVINMLAGNYATPDGNNVVFGIKQPFYSGNKHDTDPGIFSHYIKPDFSSIDILYGEGRVSHGDPSSPNFGKMPGGGGAAALMGPMEWNVTITTEGLTARVTNDERFVDHNPRIDNVTELTKLQCPYEGIDGKWAFASVIPLTHSLLRLFPADVLTLMRGEIYARHGDTFTNPNTQRYFDAQPWYKRSNKPIKLTDVERFNYALIKQVENEKKNIKNYKKYKQQ